jgi:hypothetical protein
VILPLEEVVVLPEVLHQHQITLKRIELGVEELATVRGYVYSKAGVVQESADRHNLTAG